MMLAANCEWVHSVHLAGVFLVLLYCLATVAEMSENGTQYAQPRRKAKLLPEAATLPELFDATYFLPLCSLPCQATEPRDNNSFLASVAKRRNEEVSLMKAVLRKVNIYFFNRRRTS